MAATTKLLQLRPKTLSSTTTHTPTSIHFFSSSADSTDHNSNQPSSSDPTPPPSPPQFESAFSSVFSDIKARLKQPHQQTSPQSQQIPRKTFSFNTSHQNQPTPPSGRAQIEQIRKNLSEFRARTVAPPPPSYGSDFSSPPPPNSPPQISFEKLYKENVASKGQEGSTPDSQKPSRPRSLQDIRDRLRYLKSSPTGNRSDRSWGSNAHMSVPKFTENLRMSVDPVAKPSPIVIGGSGSLPQSVFGPEIRANDGGDSSDETMKMTFWKRYDHKELGEKLRMLRPEKKGDNKDWFSVEELCERLVKLREMDKSESKSGVHGFSLFSDIRQGLTILAEKNQKDNTNASKFGAFI